MNNSNMCKLYVKAGLAYENDEKEIISDTTYDELGRILLKRYNKLPKWFTNKITESELQTGSAAEFNRKFSRDIFEV